jgi:hypothetical protein
MIMSPGLIRYRWGLEAIVMAYSLRPVVIDCQRVLFRLVAASGSQLNLSYFQISRASVL